MLKFIALQYFVAVFQCTIQGSVFVAEHFKSKKEVFGKKQ